MMKKITYKTPVVEIQGDEMTRILWDDITGDFVGMFKRGGIAPVKLSSRAFLEKVGEALNLNSF